jgi:hypothetical protein
MPAIQVFSGGIKFLKDHLFRNFKERVPQLQDGDIHWVLTVPIFQQLYRSDHFYWWRKLENPEKTTDLS